MARDFGWRDILVIWRLDYFRQTPKRQPRRWPVYRILDIGGAAVILIGAAVIFCWPKFHSSVSHRADPIIDETNELYDIQSAVNEYAGINRQFPGPNLSDIIAVGGDPRFGVDAWGHSLVYRMSSDPTHAILYSCGPDGIDNNGDGDDIEVDLDIGPLPPTTNAR